MLLSKLFLHPHLLLGAIAATIDIDVGDGSFVFEPDTSTAAVGDELHFHFYPQNHSVIQGDFTNACHPVASGGFYSGFMPVDSDEGANMFVVTVSNKEPMFFYCGQAGHCKAGMVGVVNPSSSETLDSYRSAANKATSVIIPPSVAGGKIVPNAESDESSTAPSSPGTATSTSTVTSSGPVTTPTTTTTGSAPASTVPSGSTTAASTPSPTTVTTSNSNNNIGDLVLCIQGSIGVMILTQALVALIF